MNRRNDLVAHNRDGSRLIASADATVPQVTFQALGHSAASLLLAEGVELVEVSMLLGHSELRVNADFYSHLQKQTAAKAAQRMGAVLKG